MKIDELIQELEELEGNDLILLTAFMSLAFDFYPKTFALTAFAIYYGWIKNAYQRINSRT